MPGSTFATPGYSRSAKGVQEVRCEHFDGRHLSVRSVTCRGLVGRSIEYLPGAWPYTIGTPLGAPRRKVPRYRITW